MIAVLLRRVQACLSRIKARASRCNFAGSSCASRSQFVQCIQIVLSLVAREAVLLNLGCGSLPFGLGSVVRDRVKVCPR